MSGLPILDVAIGLVFVYLLLSLICTALNEGLMTQMRSRAKYLDQGLEALLGPTAKKKVLDHALIQSYQNKKGDSVLRKAGRKVRFKSATADTCPSYLSSFAFARAVQDLYAQPGAGLPPSQPKSLPDSHGPEASGKGEEAPKVDNKDLVQLQETLQVLLAGTKEPADQIKILSEWYDDGMDRVRGWYKRHTQAWARFLALVIAIGLNADTLQITKHLWSDPTVRAKVVAAAQARSNNPPKSKTANYKSEDEAIPEETSGEVGAGKTQTLGGDQEAISDTEQQLLGELTGWNTEREQYEALKDETGTTTTTQKASFAMGVLANHWLGWLLTAIAVSLGAPFWFDTLNRFMNIRNAGRAPDEPRDKGNKSSEVQDA